MVSPTFEECYCAEHGITPAQYGQKVFKQALYRRALPVAWLLSWTNHNHFTADHDLIKAVAHLRRLRDFSNEAENFRQHPYNRGWLRWRLGMRVSTNRLRSIIKTTFQRANIPASEALPQGATPSV